MEVPVYADQYGFHPTYIGALPMQLAAMNQSNLTTQGLAAQAAIEADPELVYWAIAMDPLTSTKVTLNECRNMVADLFEAEAKWLPQFEGKTFKRLNDIDVPEGTVGVPVPKIRLWPSTTVSPSWRNKRERGPASCMRGAGPCLIRDDIYSVPAHATDRAYCPFARGES